MPKLEIIVRDGPMTADEMANEAERIAAMIRDGFTEGEVLTETGGGWWRLSGVEG